MNSRKKRIIQITMMNAMDIAYVREVTSGSTLSQILLTKRQQRHTWNIFLQKLSPTQKRNPRSGLLLKYIFQV